MPRGRPSREEPRAHCDKTYEKDPDEEWPDLPLDPNAPPEVLLVHDIARRLRDLVDKKIARPRGPKTIVHLAEDIDGVSHQTIRNIIQGRVWPDLITIARLERYFTRKLWGNAHMPPRGKRDDTTDSRTPDEPTTNTD